MGCNMGSEGEGTSPESLIPGLVADTQKAISKLWAIVTIIFKASAAFALLVKFVLEKW